MAMRGAPLSAVLAVCLLGAALATEDQRETGAVCSPGSDSSRCVTQGSVMLQRSQRRAAVRVHASEADEAFCCFHHGGSCDTCSSPSKPGDWCAISEANCELCSPGKSLWCDGQAQAPAPAPTPSHGGQGGKGGHGGKGDHGGKGAHGGNGHGNGGSGSTGSGNQWDGGNMKMTHYWDCSGQGCDAATLQPWNMDKYITPPGYGPQDPADFGGARYGEKMWLTGAASDALSALMGPDDGCCGGDSNDGGVGGCGKCLLIQNPDSAHPDWTAVVMKKNRCPPHSNGCGANQPHFDIAAPGFDNLQFSTANVCGIRPGTGFASQQQSETLGKWYTQCADTAECEHLCGELPAAFQKGCRLFASWGWRRGDPDSVKFRAVECPQAFVGHVGSLFGASGPALVETA